MKQYFGNTRPDNYWWFVKGTEGWTGVVMVVLMAISYTLAQPWFRRNRLNLPKTLKKLTGFNAFWYSHHLFVIVYVLFIVHGYFLYLSKKWYKKTVSIFNFQNPTQNIKRVELWLTYIALYRCFNTTRTRHFLNFLCATILPQTWMYLAVPVLLYASERLLRAFRSGYKTVRILKVRFYLNSNIRLYILLSYKLINLCAIIGKLKNVY